MVERGSADPKFSLIFLTWNSEDCIERTIESVRSQEYPSYEIIVVDNASKDDTIDRVKKLHDEDLNILENEENLGFIRGTNQGIEAAEGEFICCYNDDTYFPSAYLQTLDENVSEDAVWTTARVNHRVSAEHKVVRLLTRHRFPIPYVVDSLSGVTRVNYVPGDGILIPRQIYENELNKQVFDPEMSERGEDVDLSLRLQGREIPIRAVLDTYSIHPDEGFYKPTINNALKHLENVNARYQAYRKNDFGALVLASIIASTITVPFEIYFRSFPRNQDSFSPAVDFFCKSK